MRYVSKGKFYDIIEKEIDSLKCNSDCGLYESCKLNKNGKPDLSTIDWEYYEDFIYNEAFKNVLKKYKIKYKGYDVSKALNSIYHRIY